MNILSIGNSFSHDAQRYLHSIAKSGGYELNSFNLYIGGCSLSTHYRNMLSCDRCYMLDMNGTSTGFKVSLKEALLNRDWDVITLQQVSTQSVCFDSFNPYISKLADFVRECVPKAKIAIHQTWAYEDNSPKLLDVMGYDSSSAMFKDIKKSYQLASDAINADFIIPSGEVMQKLIELKIGKAHRDTSHASYGIGRYALGLIWYKTLTGNDITNNTFSDFDEEITSSQIKKIKSII